jgi:hypothetical protein
MRLVLLLRKQMVALDEQKTAAVAAMREAVGKETAAREALIEAERVRSPQPAAAAAHLDAPDAPPHRGVAFDLVANAERLRALGVDARRGMMIEGLANLEAGAFELSDESSSSDDEAAREEADEAARDEAAHDDDVAVVEDLVVLEAEDRASVKRSRVTRSSSRG